MSSVISMFLATPGDWGGAIPIPRHRAHHRVIPETSCRLSLDDTPEVVDSSGRVLWLSQSPLPARVAQLRSHAPVGLSGTVVYSDMSAHSGPVTYRVSLGWVWEESGCSHEAVAAIEQHSEKRVPGANPVQPDPKNKKSL